MVQGIDSMSTNNLTHPVTQCACVLCHKAHIRHLIKMLEHHFDCRQDALFAQ